MIEFDHVTITYSGAGTPTLSDVCLAIPEGDLVLVAGRTGTGKSTLLGAVNGLVPHFTGGTLHGEVSVAGRSTRDHPPREMADLVGVVRQDPAAGFVTDIVEDELAYTMESLAVPPPIMRRRVEETLDLLGLADLRDRPLRTLSGGQQQRVAIGSVLTAHPQVLVLDEPTSALDPQAAEEVLAAIQRLVHDLGMTIILAEHRLERVVQYADAVVLLSDGGEAQWFADPASAMEVSPVAPPIVELGRWAGWSPLPLSIRDARRRASSLRQEAERGGAVPTPPVAHRATTATAALRRVEVTRGGVRALRGLSMDLHPGEVVGVLGRNGAGKSTALSVLAGALRPGAGTATVAGLDPAALSGAELLRHVALVPQEPGDLLFAESVDAECSAADHDAGRPPGTTLATARALCPGIRSDTHPGDLSEGTRLCLALAIMLSAPAALLLLDEPTRGLDYETKQRLVTTLRGRAADGQAIVLATHDVELVAELCTRVLLLADGELVLDDEARSAVTASPSFSPQVARIMSPLPYLTVAEVQSALPARRPQ